MIADESMLEEARQHGFRLDVDYHQALLEHFEKQHGKEARGKLEVQFAKCEAEGRFFGRGDYERLMSEIKN